MKKIIFFLFFAIIANYIYAKPDTLVFKFKYGIVYSPDFSSKFDGFMLTAGLLKIDNNLTNKEKNIVFNYFASSWLHLGYYHLDKLQDSLDYKKQFTPNIHKFFAKYNTFLSEFLKAINYFRNEEAKYNFSKFNYYCDVIGIPDTIRDYLNPNSVKYDIHRALFGFDVRYFENIQLLQKIVKSEEALLHLGLGDSTKLKEAAKYKKELEKLTKPVHLNSTIKSLVSLTAEQKQELEKLSIYWD